MVGGNLSAAGILEVVLAANSPVIQEGDVFDLLAVTGIASGAFDAFSPASLTTGLVWNVSGLLTSGELSVVVDVDLDNDGWITGSDFLAIQRTNPSLIPQWQVLYRAQVVSGTGLVGAATAVPEPAVFAMLALSLLMGACPTRPALAEDRLLAVSPGIARIPKNRKSCLTNDYTCSLLSTQ